MQITHNFRGTNLHSLWDSGIIEYKKMTLPDCLKANTYSKNEIRAIQDVDVVYRLQVPDPTYLKSTKPEETKSMTNT